MPSKTSHTPYDYRVSTLESTIGNAHNNQTNERMPLPPSVEADGDAVYHKLGDSTTNEIKKKMKRRSHITANVSYCKYELVKTSIEASGMALLKEDSPALSGAFLIWYDSVVATERIQELKNYQHVNHFPGMGEICRKDFLARNMAKMHRARPGEFSFIPRSWNMPSEYNLLLLYAKDAKKNKKKVPTFIQKPANGAMGNGIQLFRNVDKIQPNEHTIVQEYLDKPLLLDGYKIDLRLYALVTHCDPLKVFLYQDGLVRLGTEKYASPTESNMTDHYMHLTNYSVNKTNDKFERHSDFDRGSKRSVKSLLNHLRVMGYDTVSLWRHITDLIVKTIIVASPHVLHSYRMCRPGQPPHSDSVCFEILGFDIFLDRKLKPWLLEVNRAPSFGGDEKIDRDIKGGLLRDALRLIRIRASDKRRNMANQKAETQRRLFRPAQPRLTATYLSATAQRKFIVNRRKEELKEKLSWVRKEAAREEHEDANSGGYVRVFPCLDKLQQERYTNLLSDAFRMFLQSRSAPFQKNIIDHYKLQREDEILDLIEQCEAEEGIRPAPSKTLSSMPVLTPPSSRTSSRRNPGYPDSSSDDSDSDESSVANEARTRDVVIKSSPEAEKAAYLTRFGSGKPRVNVNPPSRAASRSGRRSAADRSFGSNTRSKTHSRDRNRRHGQDKDAAAKRSSSVQSFMMIGGSEGLMRPTNRNNPNVSFPFGTDDVQSFPSGSRDRVGMNTSRTLMALERTRIKFPGKTDAEANKVLDGIMEDWKVHKIGVANYWFVKLDSVKRRKVIDIVRGNVRAVMQRVWRTTDVDSNHLMRLFNRLFNRMHWSHGQGLWNCFTTSSSSWETIFSKSTDTVTDVELQCCRRIVRLCKDCLLIVYQFANDARSHAIVPASSEESPSSSNLTRPALASSRGTLVAFEDLPRRFSRAFTTSAANQHEHLLTSQRGRRSGPVVINRPISHASILRS